MSYSRFAVIIGVILLAFGSRAQANLGVDWQQATATPAWHERANHSAMVFKNRIWIMGGSHDNNTQNSESFGLDDVWSSADGATWELEVLHAPWGPRSSAPVVEFNGKLWIMGGIRLDNEHRGLANDVWSSSDGIHWTQVLAAAPWIARRGHRALVFDNKIWIMGGSYETSTATGGQTLSLNDVWSSSDGQQWTQVTGAADWPGRQNCGAVVFKNRLWVMGGYRNGLDYSQDLSDVWSSADGLTWRKELEYAPWGPRENVQLVVSSGCLWLIGGTSTSPTMHDVWVSHDGKSWTKVTDAAPWSERSACTPLIFDSKLFIIGGWHYTYDQTYGTYLKEVWFSREQSVLTLSPNGGDYLPVGGFYEVHWKTDPTVAGTAVKVELWNGAGRVAELGTDSDPSGEHTFKPFFPLVPVGSDYRVRVISQSDPTLFDDSDSPFIMAIPIRILSPNGGEVLETGKPTTILWQTNTNIAGTAVRLELWNRAGKVADLGNSYAEDGNGAARITLPKVIASTDYRIKAVSLWDNQWTDTSDADFNIIKAQEAAVTPETWAIYQ